jgi:hypothetical protein
LLHIGLAAVKAEVRAANLRLRLTVSTQRVAGTGARGAIGGTPHRASSPASLGTRPGPRYEESSFSPIRCSGSCSCLIALYIATRVTHCLQAGILHDALPTRSPALDPVFVREAVLRFDHFQWPRSTDHIPWISGASSLLHKVKRVWLLLWIIMKMRLLNLYLAESDPPQRLLLLFAYRRNHFRRTSSPNHLCHIRSRYHALSRRQYPAGSLTPPIAITKGCFITV